MKPKIVSVEAYEGDWKTIDIELDNCSSINISLEVKRNEPLIDEVIREHLMPHTDGGRVYWINGAVLTLEEITDMLRDSGEKE